MSVLILSIILTCSCPSPKINSTAQLYTYKIINIYPHDQKAFTQGLVFENGFLYEGTGLYGKSTLKKVQLETGQSLKSYKLPKKYFGEGITIFDDKIIQLTYKSRLGFVYNKETFEPIREFNYPTEGWGLTHNGTKLIISDGTDTLYFLNPETFEITGELKVTEHNLPIKGLNELEYIRNQIYANIWPTDTIVIIDPETGNITGRAYLTGLLTATDSSNRPDVLNGIAYDASNKRLFVTGKLWPKLFEIKLVPLN